MKVSSGSVVKNLPANAGNVGSVPRLGRSPREGNGYPLQYSCLENPMDRGVWWATIYGVAKSWKVGPDLGTKQRVWEIVSKKVIFELKYNVAIQKSFFYIIVSLSLPIYFSYVDYGAKSNL